MSRGGTRIYLGRLPRDVREKDLERFVRGYGRIREISIKVGYGFVVSLVCNSFESFATSCVSTRMNGQ